MKNVIDYFINENINVEIFKFKDNLQFYVEFCLGNLKYI